MDVLSIAPEVALDEPERRDTPPPSHQLTLAEIKSEVTAVLEGGGSGVSRAQTEKALSLVAEMKPEWWEKRRENHPSYIALELEVYAEERLKAARREQTQGSAQERGVEQRGPETRPEKGGLLGAAPQRCGPQSSGLRQEEPRKSALAGGPRRSPCPGRPPSTPPLSPEKLASREMGLRLVETMKADGDITIAVPDSVRDAVYRAVYLFHVPNDRSLSPFTPQKVKPEDQLSARSLDDYKRACRQVASELAALGKKNFLDVAAYLANTARVSSRSSYKRLRSAVLRSMMKEYEDCRSRGDAAGKREALATVRLIQSLPPYGELCETMKVAPSRVVSEVTKARRARQNPATLDRLLDRLSPRDRDIILLLRYTGARADEAQTVQLAREDGTIRVTARTLKTGARRTPQPPVVTRTFAFPLDSAEGGVLSGILDRQGEQPACGVSGDTIRKFWYRARQEEDKTRRKGSRRLADHPTWCLHAFRHQFAHDRKAERGAAMVAAYGPNWRVERYGKDWRNDNEYKEAWLGDLARMLGHNTTDTARMYG